MTASNSKDQTLIFDYSSPFERTAALKRNTTQKLKKPFTQL